MSAMKLMTDSNGEENEKDVSPRADVLRDDMDKTSDRKRVMDVLAAIPSAIMPFAFSKEEASEKPPADSLNNSNGATLKSTLCLIRDKHEGEKVNTISHECIPGDYQSS